jgi:dienelactone hydrolase
LLLSDVYDTFCNDAVASNCRKLASYLSRQRVLIIAWSSPTDGKISLSSLTLPKDWNPEASYPLYIHLHGLSSLYNSSIDCLSNYYKKGVNTSFAYEDGYLLTPWGRGNYWYQGISETDIFECKAELESKVKIDLKRVYITGHSMGGYGAWYIASRSANVWAAMGIEAGALWYGSNSLNNDVIQKLINIPTYFVTGIDDNLMNINWQAFTLLKNAGNKNIKFETFQGGHEHLKKNDENLYLWIKNFIKDDNTYNKEPINLSFNKLQCYPNPFSSATSIKFELEKNSWVNLSIFNSEGKHIETLINKNMLKGAHDFVFSNSTLPPDLYFCRLQIDNKQCMKIIMIHTK